MMEQFWVDNHYLWRNKRLLLDENIDQGGHFFKEKNIVTQKTNNFDFVFQKCMAHFEEFRWKWNISSSIHLLLLKSVIETYLQLFFSKNTSNVFSNISFFKGTLFDFGNPICMWHWQNRTLCHKHILNKTQSKFHPLNTVVGVNHKN